MNFRKYIILLIFLVLGTTLIAQLNLEITHYGGELNLKWFPMNPKIWEQGNQTGYQIERWELTENGQVKANTKTILVSSPPLQPKDSLWFVENGALQNYYVAALGDLLYDPDFQYESDLLDAKKLRYDYLLREAMYSDNTAAHALGLHYTDSTMVDGLLYRYRVFATQNGRILAEAQADMDAETGTFVSNEVDLEFDLPDGKSITEMSGRLNNVPIDMVVLTGKAYEDSIVLRWGPNTPAFWEAANEQGYLLMRMEIGEGEVNIDSIGRIYPWPQDSLSEAIAGDDMALVAAQSLYGAMDAPPTNMFDEASLFENRHAFALYAAERSKLAGDILGLRYVDRQVETGKTYTYYVNSPASTYAMSGRSFEIENRYIPDPTPFGFVAAPRDSSILLKWEIARNQEHFSGYFVERSDDGGQTFYRLNEQPLVFLEDDRLPLEFYSILDSTNTNEVSFVYRLIGLTSFADLSPPAEVRAQSKDRTPPPNPIFTFADLLEDTATMEIRWRIVDYPQDFLGFQVLLGKGPEGLFDTLTNIVPQDSLRFIYRPEKYTERLHFFKVLAWDTNRNAGESVARYVHYPDFLPPEPPQNVEGLIDKNGHLSLFWDHSTSNDVTGYFVYSSHDTNSVFLPRTDYALTENFFRDTLPTHVMNEVIYYYVVAQDDNYNKSGIGEIVEIERPDFVPPMTPHLNPTVSTDSAIIVSWARSGSEDVVLYEVLKRTVGDTIWEVLHTVYQDTNRVYFDTTCEMDRHYEYSVRVMDDAENYSEHAFPFSGSLRYDFDKIAIQNLQVVLDESGTVAQLQWEFQPPPKLPPNANSYSFFVFKSEGRAAVKSFAQLDGQTFQFIDEKVQAGVLHNYAVMVVYDSGASSSLSEVKSILIEE